MSLTATSSNGVTGTGGSTNNPQSGATTTPGQAGQQAKDFQSAAGTSSLDNQSGAPLTPAKPTVVNLSTSTSHTSVPTATSKTHHISTIWIIIPIVLVIAAVALFWALGSDDKNTTI